MRQAKATSDYIAKHIEIFIQKITEKHLTKREIKDATNEFRTELRTSLFNKFKALPNLEIIINTSNLQDISDQEKLVRITLNVEEMGLEWSVHESSDGEIKESLVPE